MGFPSAIARAGLALAGAFAVSGVGAQSEPLKSVNPSPLRSELRQLKLKPDLVVRKLRLKSYGPCNARRPVLTFEAVIANRGNAAAPALRHAAIVKVAENNGAGPWSGSARLDRAIPPGGTANVSVPIYYLQSDPSHMVSGAPHRFRAKVDPLDRISESREDNNLSAAVQIRAPTDCLEAAEPALRHRPDIGKTLKPRRPAPRIRRNLIPLRPDLAVSAVQAEERSCELSKVGLRLINLSKGKLPESAWRPANGVAVDIRLDGRIWGRVTLADADPEKLLLRYRLQSRPHIVTLPARTLTMGTHRLTVTVDSGNAIAESNERNNTSGRQILCSIEPDADAFSTPNEDGLGEFPGPARRIIEHNSIRSG